MPSVKKINRSVTVPRATESVAGAKRKKLKPEPRQHRISELGWTRDQAAQVRSSLSAFDADWDASGMAEYDKL